jgi:hypothetical protein
LAVEETIHGFEDSLARRRRFLLVDHEETYLFPILQNT